MNSVRAVVTAIKGEGEKRYAVTRIQFPSPDIGEDESITFTLCDAWQDCQDPVAGQAVVLERITSFEHGLRALVAHPCLKQTENQQLER